MIKNRAHSGFFFCFERLLTDFLTVASLGISPRVVKLLADQNFRVVKRLKLGFCYAMSKILGWSIDHPLTRPLFIWKHKQGKNGFSLKKNVTAHLKHFIFMVMYIRTVISRSLCTRFLTTYVVGVLCSSSILYVFLTIFIHI